MTKSQRFPVSRCRQLWSVCAHAPRRWSARAFRASVSSAAGKLVTCVWFGMAWHYRQQEEGKDFDGDEGGEGDAGQVKRNASAASAAPTAVVVRAVAVS